MPSENFSQEPSDPTQTIDNPTTPVDAQKADDVVAQHQQSIATFAHKVDRALGDLEHSQASTPSGDVQETGTAHDDPDRASATLTDLMREADTIEVRLKTAATALSTHNVLPTQYGAPYEE